MAIDADGLEAPWLADDVSPPRNGAAAARRAVPRILLVGVPLGLATALGIASTATLRETRLAWVKSPDGPYFFGHYLWLGVASLLGWTAFWLVLRERRRVTGLGRDLLVVLAVLIAQGITAAWLSLYAVTNLGPGCVEPCGPPWW